MKEITSARFPSSLKRCRVWAEPAGRFTVMSRHMASRSPNTERSSWLTHEGYVASQVVVEVRGLDGVPEHVEEATA